MCLPGVGVSLIRKRETEEKREDEGGEEVMCELQVDWMYAEVLCNKFTHITCIYTLTYIMCIYIYTFNHGQCILHSHVFIHDTLTTHTILHRKTQHTQDINLGLLY